MLLTPVQPKIKALKILYYVPHHANEYAKEKEEKEKEKKKQLSQNVMGSY